MDKRSVFAVALFLASSALSPARSGASAYDQQALIALARESVEAAVNGKTQPKAKEQSPPKPVFVTIEIGGQVRGCRGSLELRKGSLEEEIVEAATSAAGRDPRYKPLIPKDLKNFKVTVTVVEDQQPIGGVEGLQPEEGLVLKSGSRVGVVLPWEGKDPNVRLDWAYRKAGVPKGSAVSLFRLMGERFRG